MDGSPVPVTVDIEGLEVYAYHGVLPEEKTLGQRFVFDLTLVMDSCSGVHSDRVEDTVDYSAVLDAVTEVATFRSYGLLEKLAFEVGRALLDRFPVDEVQVRVQKPAPPVSCTLEGVSVTLSVERGRPDSTAS